MKIGDNQWISVDTELPVGDYKKGVKVLAYSPSTIGQTTAWYHGPEPNKTPHPMTKGWSLMGVTHWQPLPENP